MTRSTCLAVAVLLLAGCPRPAEAPAPSPSPAAPAAAPTAKNPEGCNSDFAQPLVAHHTLTAACSPYTLGSALVVKGFDLTVEAGVEVRVAASGSLRFGDGAPGRLIARGTAEKPVRFVAAERKEPGSWSGLVFGDRSEGSSLEHVVVEHAGTDDGQALRFESGGHTVKGLTVIGSKGPAMRLASPTGFKALSGIDLRKSGEAPAAIVGQLGALGTSGFSAQLRPGAVIELSGDVQHDVTLTAVGAPYRLVTECSIHGASDGKSATLVVEPGVVLEMAQSAAFWVGYEVVRPGQLKAPGTRDQPIVFRRYGDDAAATPFRGVQLYAGARALELEWVTFEHAGTPEKAALVFEDTKALGRLAHVTFKGGTGGAIDVRRTSERFSQLEHVSFADVKGTFALRLPLVTAHQLSATNTFAKGTWVELEGEPLDGEVELAALSVPYRRVGPLTIDAARTGTEASLTLAAGTTLQVGAEAEVTVGGANAGTLVAKGTAAKPVKLEAFDAAWRGISVTAHGTLQLEHTTLAGTSSTLPAIELRAQSKGALKAVTVKHGKIGAEVCSDQVTIRGLEGPPGGKAQAKDGC